MKDEFNHYMLLLLESKGVLKHQILELSITFMRKMLQPCDTIHDKIIRFYVNADYNFQVSPRKGFVWI